MSAFPFTIEEDIYHESKIFDVLNIIEKYKGIIIYHKARGPAGENPVLHIKFPSKKLAQEYLIANGHLQRIDHKHQLLPLFKKR